MIKSWSALFLWQLVCVLWLPCLYGWPVGLLYSQIFMQALFFWNTIEIPLHLTLILLTKYVSYSKFILPSAARLICLFCFVSELFLPMLSLAGQYYFFSPRSQELSSTWSLTSWTVSVICIISCSSSEMQSEVDWLYQHSNPATNSYDL